MLTDDAPACQDAILLFLLLVQLAFAWFLLGSLALAVQFLYSLIASICSTLDLCLYGELAPLEQCAIVLASLAYCDTDDLECLMRDDDLRFLGMAFLLPTIVWPLFF